MDNIKSIIEEVTAEFTVLEKTEQEIKAKKAQILKKLTGLPIGNGKIYICQDHGIPYIRLAKKENGKRKLYRIKSPKDIFKLI
jgi:hypothetical protein